MCKSDDLIKAVLEQAQDSDGRKNLACVEAFKLAQELDVEAAEIGRICNQHNIRICKCQLGCFQ